MSDQIQDILNWNKIPPKVNLPVKEDCSFSNRSLLSKSLAASTFVGTMSILDEIKRTLVGFRGGDHKDQAHILVDLKDTEVLLQYFRKFTPVSLITQDKCSKFYTKNFWGQKKYFDRDIKDLAALRFNNPSSASALYFVTSYLEVILDNFDVPSDHSKLIWDSFNKASLWRIEDFVKNAKFLTAYPMAKYLRQKDMPQKPESVGSPYFFGGSIAKFMRSRLVSKNKKSIRLFQSILQGVKRGANVVPDVFIKSSLQKHLTTMVEPPKRADPIFWDSFIEYSDRLLSRFRFSESDIASLYHPSLSATHTFSRAKGGQYYEVEKWLQDQQLVGTNHFTELDGIYETGPSVYKEHRVRYVDPDYKTHLVRDILPGTYQNGFSTRSAELKITARVVAITEPLKVRIITAGEGLPYFLGKSFQKCLWGYLQKHPQFSLIGEPITVNHLMNLISREDRLEDIYGTVVPKDFFVSGDYSAATDNLSITYTLTLMDRVIERIRKRSGISLEMERYLNVMRSLLAPHNLVYPYNEVIDIVNSRQIPHTVIYENRNKNGILTPFPKSIVIEQKNGQLMGSPISFPFLCIINLITYWSALETYTGKKIKFTDLPVLVNGDDILFRSDDRHYQLWMSSLSEVGFTLSLGKNYRHESILTINSECFLYKKKTNEFQLIPFFNVGLLMAQSKGHVASNSRQLSFIDLYIAAVGNATDRLRAHNRFIHYNLKQIKMFTNHGLYNLFIPLRLGGLGFPVYPEVYPYIKVTSFQQRFATFLDRKVRDSLLVGTFPKKYFFALVSEQDTSSVLERWRGKKTLSLFPFGPLPNGFQPLVEPLKTQYEPFEEFVDIQIDSLPPQIRYRLPSKSLMREFNRKQRILTPSSFVHDAQTSRMSINEILFNPLTRVVETTVPVIGTLMVREGLQ